MEIKEFLEKQANGEYVLSCSYRKECDDWIEVPEGAELYAYWPLDKDKTFHSGQSFFEDGVWTCSAWNIEEIKTGAAGADVLWQRHTQPESLPFIDDEVQSINDQYAEIEKVRQAAKDNVNHPSHYADSAIECIDAMEAMMTPEQFIGYLRGNLFKYQWRYEKKNGIEDLKKAQWYLEKLTVKIAEKNAMF